MRIRILVVLIALFALRSLGGAALAQSDIKAEIRATKAYIQELVDEKAEVRVKLEAARAILADLRARRDQATDRDERQSLKAKLEHERAQRNALKARRDELRVKIAEAREHLDYLRQVKANS